VKVVVFSLLIVAVCYFNAVSLPFVQSDDFLIVASNPGIRSIAPLRFLGEPYWVGYKFGGIYRPLTIFSFSIDYAVWHRWASGYRLTNLLLHTLNGCLVFLVTFPLIGSGAWAATAVYLIHPVHTEAIVGIVGRAELLAAAFFLAAWLMFRRGRIGLAAGLFFLSMLSKENAIVFPAVVALEIAFLNGGAKKLLNAWRRFLPLAGVALAYLGLRFSVLRSIGVPAVFQYLHGGLTLRQRWMTSGRSFIEYFRLAVAPVNVAGSYEFNSIHIAGVRDWDAWAGLAIVFGTILLAIFLRRKYPVVSLAILFFFIALLPVSNWIMPISVLLAERFLYLPVFGVALLAGSIWKALPNRRLQYLVAAGVCIPSMLLCISHNWIWQDEFTFFRNMVRVTPDNLTARVGFGRVLQNAGILQQAREEFEAGLRIDPNSPILLSNLAGVLVQADPQHCEQVLPLLDRAFKVEPHHWQASWVLANCYAQKGKSEEADALYRSSVENAPLPDSNLFYSWGVTLEALGKRDAALDIYRQAAVVSPDDPGIQRKLAMLLPGGVH
jgi:tetratricopeptide (TPR) repeat protein